MYVGKDVVGIQANVLGFVFLKTIISLADLTYNPGLFIVLSLLNTLLEIQQAHKNIRD